MANVNSIQKKLNKAYKKVGKNLGHLYSVYRPNDMPNISYKNDPLDMAYWVAEDYCSFAKDENYSSAQRYDIPLWKTYINGDVLKTGDVLYSFDLEKTYVVISFDSTKPIVSIQADTRISIYDTTWSTSGALTSTDTVIATNLPSNRQSGGGTGDNSFAPIPTDVTIGLESWTYRFWMPQNTVRQGMVIQDDEGNRSNILQANWSDQGYVIRAREFNPNIS